MLPTGLSLVVTAVLLAGCAGAERTSTAEAPAQEATAAEVGAGEADAEGDALCTALDGVLEVTQDFLEAEVGSEQERDAVELLGQLGREVVDLTGGDPPALAEAVDLLHAEAAAFVGGEATSRTEADLDAALATVRSAADSCATGPIDPAAVEAPAADPEVEGGPAECPAPETLEAEGLQCDEFGNLTAADG
jgi:hypothetical protein